MKNKSEKRKHRRLLWKILDENYEQKVYKGRDFTFQQKKVQEQDEDDNGYERLKDDIHYFLY